MQTMLALKGETLFSDKALKLTLVVSLYRIELKQFNVESMNTPFWVFSSFFFLNLQCCQQHVESNTSDVFQV